MNKTTWTMVLGFLAGLGLGCTTAAVIAQDKPTAAVPTEGSVEAPVVMRGSEAPVRVAPNGKARAWLYATGHNAFLGRLEMDAGAAVPEHRDPTEEYIYVLEGSGTMTIDGVSYEVTPDTAILMPANALVSFQNGDRPMRAIQVFAGPGPAVKYDAWTPASP